MQASRIHVRINDAVPRPVIVGTDIKVSQIANESVRLGMSAGEIVEAHPHLTLADVHAALAYYDAHQETIHRDWQEAAALMAAMQAR